MRDTDDWGGMLKEFPFVPKEKETDMELGALLEAALNKKPAFTFEDIGAHLKVIEKGMLELDAYMPALATILRIHADKMADKYPDDTNGGN